MPVPCHGVVEMAGDLGPIKEDAAPCQQGFLDKEMDRRVMLAGAGDPHRKQGAAEAEFSRQDA